MPEYWLVDPIGKTIEIDRLEGAGYRLAQTASRAEPVRAATLPDLEFPAGRLFIE